MKTEKVDEFESAQYQQDMIDSFRRECEIICTNEYELCDIILDICYVKEKTKQFAWDICGNVILKNLLRNNRNIISFPERVNTDGEFEYCGEQFIMCKKVIDEDDYIERERVCGRVSEE